VTCGIHYTEAHQLITELSNFPFLESSKKYRFL
jgi:hypothetical protein